MIANREVIERSLSDMKFYHKLNNIGGIVVRQLSDRQEERERTGRHAMSLWSDTLMSCITSIVPGNYKHEYMPQLEFDEFMDLIDRYMEDALDRGIDYKLEALYAGVPYDDIVA